MIQGGSTKQVWMVGIAVGLMWISCASPQRVARGEDVTLRQVARLAMSAQLPMHFEPNLGQTDTQVRFLARGRGYTLWLTETAEAVLALQQSIVHRGPSIATADNTDAQPPTVVRMRLVDANPSPQIEGIEELPGKAHYFLGNDSSQWRTNVPTYAKVHYAAVYPGIDLVYYGNQRNLEHDFIVQPGADPAAIRLVFEGADHLALDAQGALVLAVNGEELRFPKPCIYQQDLNGRRVAIDGSFQLVARHSTFDTRHAVVGFQLARYDTTKPLVIDPTLVYSTYLGGNGFDEGTGIDVDAAGNIYIEGSTASTNFPTTNPPPFGGNYDVFVAKFNPSLAGPASLVYSTYLGGNSNDRGYAIAVDASGSAYVTGRTFSLNFPTMNAYQTGLGGGTGATSDAFVTKLTPNGSALVYSTYFGSTTEQTGYGIAVNSAGQVYLTGLTSSGLFTTVNAAQPVFGGGTGGNLASDAFIAKFNPSASGQASLVYSTYLGGSGNDRGYAIAVDASGAAYVTGDTALTATLPAFPTVNPFQATNMGGFPFPTDAFVTKLNAAGTAWVYSTYLGGSNTDYGTGIAVGNTGNVYVTGGTTSLNFPTQNPVQPTHGGGTYDAFVTKLNPANPPASQLVYSTYLGGSGSDNGFGIGVDAAGNAYVSGTTFSSNFPAANALPPTTPPNAFVTKFSVSGSSLVFSSGVGGNNPEFGSAVAVSAGGFAYLTGYTNDVFSMSFPLVNPAQSTYGGSTADAFAAMLDPRPVGVIRYGASTPACLGPITMNVTERPNQGNAAFSLTVANATPSAAGVLVISGGQDAVGTALAGVTVYVDLNSPFLLVLPIASDAAGNAIFPVPIPAGTAGLRVFIQTAWPNCGGAALSASDALDVTVQP